MSVHENPALVSLLNNVFKWQGFEVEGLLRGKQKIMQINIITVLEQNSKYSKLYLEYISKYSLLYLEFCSTYNTNTHCKHALHSTAIIQQLTCNFYRLI